MEINRRHFLTMAAATGASLSASPLLMAAPSKLILPNSIEHKELKLRNLHTGEKAKVTYWENGEYLVDALAEIYLLMRDHRANSIAAIDIQLLDQLHMVQHRLDTSREIQLISGYRSEQTNNMLRGKSKKTGVAKNSLHMQGRAMDFRIEGLNLRHVHRATLASTDGGVGYYSRSGYVHMDTGRKRSWGF